MDAGEVVREFWNRIDARDWPAVKALLADDVELVYPHTGERFRGPEAVVAINAEYPQGWSIDVRRIVAVGDSAASEVAVPTEGTDYRAATFWTVRDGRITAATEYWTEAGAATPPAWRAPYTT